MSGGPDAGWQLAPSVEGRWWVIPARPGYGAAAQPIAGKPAPTPAASNSCLVYYRGYGVARGGRFPVTVKKRKSPCATTTGMTGPAD